MATSAPDRLARLLRGGAEPVFSSELTARSDDLSLHVEGLGRIKFPLTPATARKLIGVGQPARFGRGEETLTDPDVRDTWEIPQHLVRASWDDTALKDALATVKEGLGLPSATELAIDFHSLLVYEPGQFFLAHQDSEKSDDMIGTLVVTLPSRYSGGELIVGHHEERKTYQPPAYGLSLVAFYADCRHEVLKVTSGYRITLTYNLLLHGDPALAEGEEGAIGELTSLLNEHFSTPERMYLNGPAAGTPDRLVYLLDHEYTPRALKWSRLKGDDANRVALLRAAAGKAGCEAILALADVHETHGAHPVYNGWEYGFADSYDDYGSDSGTGDGERELEIGELVDSLVALTHWTGPDGGELEETSLYVPATQVCASTASGYLTPYSQEYEGYMGNWGNTLDRWYHRAAVVVWPRGLAFVNRAEASPSWALDELAAIASSGDVSGARMAAATLASFWDGIRCKDTAEKDGSVFFGKALLAAEAVADPDVAAMLLRPLRIGSLTSVHVTSFAKIASDYGEQWTAKLLRAWFECDRPSEAFGYRQEVRQWVENSLLSLCTALHAMGDVSRQAARCMLDLTWERIGQELRSAFELKAPSQREHELRGLGKPLAAVLTAATRIDAASVRDRVTGYIRRQEEDKAVPLQMSVLRMAIKTTGYGRRGDAGLSVLAEDCAAQLRVRLALPPRDASDWSIHLPDGCTCDLCGALAAFLAAKDRRTLEWPLAKDGRQHIHARIDLAELPVTHVTRRQGRPYTLVLVKADALFTGEEEMRARDGKDLEWLRARWRRLPAPLPPFVGALSSGKSDVAARSQEILREEIGRDAR